MIDWVTLHSKLEKIKHLYKTLDMGNREECIRSWMNDCDKHRTGDDIRWDLRMKNLNVSWKEHRKLLP